MHYFLAKLWKLFRGTLQWYILWLFHDKFILGVSGVVLDKKKQVLLLRHRYWKKGSWGLPSGYAKKRETLEAAFAREVYEETGYSIKTKALLKLKSGYRLRLEAHFLANWTGGELKIDSGEILQASFFPQNQLPDGLLDSHRKIINLALGTPEKTL